MSSLNSLERAVLERILRDTPGDLAPILRAQIDGATVVGRKNTGAGFFTELKVESAVGRMSERVIEDVWADIEGFDVPMTFLVFLREGIIRTLEGAAINEDATDVDFSRVGFAIKE
ncbi:hypothetical protein [Bradyrhizobium septentrionale]|uniref:Uncharacterized protein n=1 Tax=Bradyrhizobium septentrionale TaxID=1404411 RepID=A0A973W0K0_9BRAD|nr:hypothetical protein [Bradyrhizobium septentrionale]UGY14038.1 hypothetical protein HAP48_0036575 [Bradyrhizobium septentrionale]UGY22593.1 hypothetical protein HU675_0032075 [Bradyrhizobium septentrionale]